MDFSGSPIRSNLISLEKTNCLHFYSYFLSFLLSTKNVFIYGKGLSLNFAYSTIGVSIRGEYVEYVDCTKGGIIK